MNKTFKELANEPRDEAEYAGMKVQLSLTRILLKQLEIKDWTPKKLAIEVGCSEQLVSRLLHGDENWDAKTAGKFLAALDIEAELKIV